MLLAQELAGQPGLDRQQATILVLSWILARFSTNCPIRGDCSATVSQGTRCSTPCLKGLPVIVGLVCVRSPETLGCCDQASAMLRRVVFS